MGFPSIGALCKSMEDLLDAFNEAEAALNQESIGYLREGVALAERLVTDPGELRASCNKVPDSASEVAPCHRVP